jgi:PAS domain S-box-containing protein/putative nucleotidyltransferase with HDIG domain
MKNHPNNTTSPETGGDRDRYRDVLDEIQDGYFEVDLAGNFTMVNKMICHELGYTREELIGLNYQSAAPKEDIPGIFHIFHEVYRSGEPNRGYDFQMTRKDGSVLYTETSVSLLKNELGEPVGFRGISRDVTERKHVEEKLAKSHEVLQRTLDGSIKSIAKMVEMKDPYTTGHQQRVAELASAIAGEMGFSIEQAKYIYLAALIHDIGKFYVPADILSKPSKLSQIEMAMIRTHAQGSYDILSEIEFPWPLAQIAWQHHERIDGTGYPQGLGGDDILQEAKILAVSDVVEAMAHYRPYRPALGIDRALEEIELNRGILYGAAEADICLKLFREKSFCFTAGM